LKRITFFYGFVKAGCGSGEGAEKCETGVSMEGEILVIQNFIFETLLSM
jgi:hypothetical protein